MKLYHDKKFAIFFGVVFCCFLTNLSTVLSDISGITPLYRDKRVNIHSYHLFIVKYDKQEFGEIDKNRFIEALNAEGVPCARGQWQSFQAPTGQPVRLPADR